ncbi:type IV toxin-antitoxin system AbiEi family antitoxin domain-containing protein [Arthrobacter oryzae]|uniref:Putative AbiEi antitoxin of type IV toxin-antitoxin system n=1 Tax=Arthrobacter oryzae TaxID=409290 RepID=A0A495EFB8_9MICC|nr:type IV toxin-antitoxin system AbiEi family antitoxin domain-containing protein [Arthrobacter oryzae]RKR15584.1 putative AbiEi antitoxin of type IV toxin-antitoxin system [Arthrobacter oryzae]
MELPLILSSDLARLGQDARTLARQAKSGQLRRIRQGVYVRAREWDALTPWDRYPVLIRAAAATLRSRTVFCRQSSAALWDMPLLGHQHVVRACTSDAGGGRSRAGVRRHFVDFDSTQIEEHRGLLVTDRVRTALDLAAFESFEQGVTVFDHVLRSQPDNLAPVSREDLDAGIDGNYSKAAARRIRMALKFADPASGSPGESVSRALMHRLGFRVPLLQVEIRDARGLVAFTDFDWAEEKLCGEFDGLVKYRKAEYLQGRTPAQALTDEKRREDRIRATGRRVIRWTWSELSSPATFAAFLAAAGVPRQTLPSCRR